MAFFRRAHVRVAAPIALLSVCIAVTAAASRARSIPRAQENSWNARGAASYLDSRMAWWLTWPTAARDHNTACVSCHTALPYALARPALRTALAEPSPPAPERQLVENVVKRVQLWRDVDPFYPDQTRGLPKTSESRGTESVLNALILARRAADHGSLSADARQAFANMWALQFRGGDLKGGWAWLNFHNEPWEANSSAYLGATLAAIAIGSAPDHYASSPEIQDGVKLLASFLQRGADTVNLLNRAMLLWASGELQSILTAPQQQAIVDLLIATQRPDGGWSVSTLGAYKHADGTALDSVSDGYATGLVTLALERSRLSSSGTAVRQGLDWLTAHQDPESGRWMAASLNKARDPATDIGKFMSDAATAYAVLALTSNSR